MTRIKGVGFDFVDTLVRLDVDYEVCMLELHRSLVDDGIKVTYPHFREIEKTVNERVRRIRREELCEVGNDVWLAETLNQLGFSVTENSPEVVRAIEAYFAPYLGSMGLFPETKAALASLVGRYNLGLVSNFTYATVVHRALKQLELVGYFNPVVISHEVNRRKPHAALFEKLLLGFGLQNSEVAFVGDDLAGDIAGAQKSGLLAILVNRGPTRRYDPAMGVKVPAVGVEPDFTIGSLDELPGLLETLNKNE